MLGQLNTVVSLTTSAWLATIDRSSSSGVGWLVDELGELSVTWSPRARARFECSLITNASILRTKNQRSGIDGGREAAKDYEAMQVLESDVTDL